MEPFEGDENGEEEFQLAVSFLKDADEGGCLLQVFKWMNAAAELGHCSALTQLGHMYRDGTNGAPCDRVLAVRYYQMAIKKGSYPAERELASMYWWGEGMERDTARAIKMYTRLATERGCKTSAMLLGYSYKYGQEVEQDTEQAIFWYKKALENGHYLAKDALEKLGIKWPESSL